MSYSTRAGARGYVWRRRCVVTGYPSPVSQELENEGMQGISGGLFESFPAVVTTVLLRIPVCYYIGLRHQRHYSSDQAAFPHRSPGEQLVQVLAHFVRMPVADVNNGADYSVSAIRYFADC